MTNGQPSDPHHRLTTARAALRALLAQVETAGGFVPPQLHASVVQLQAVIAAEKAALRGAGSAVADAPEDGVLVGGETHIESGGGDVAGRDIDKSQHYHFHGVQPALAPSLDQALALLDRLPLDDIPASQTLPTPHRMPLRPNPLFVGRDAELRTLARLLREAGTVAITTGIGGMGKTQLAVELVHRYGAYFAGGVFWVGCADPVGIPGEVAACGQIMGLPVAGLDLDAQVRLTRAAWETDLPRLLIFDNCEEERVLRVWLPTTGGARVLVTSRRASWSATLKVLPVALGVLGRPASVALLQGLAARLSSKEAEQIAEALGDLPLALHLAGCYLARYPVTTQDYLTKLDSTQLQHPSLRGRGVQDMPTEREPHVERAFALSLARLDASNLVDDLARQLLARAACFAPGEPFLRAWLEATITPGGDDETQMLARTDAIERLLSLGLLEEVDAEAVRLHRLLSAYAAQTLHDNAALPAAEVVISNVAARANSTENPAPVQGVLPHLRYAVRRAAEREDMAAAALLGNLAYYFKMIGAYQEAQPLYEQAFMIRDRVVGLEHPLTVQSLNNLAELYYSQGRYAQAQQLYECALAVCERVLNAEHPYVATILSNLAELYRERGEYLQAQLLCERVLAIWIRELGENHPRTAVSLNNLALLHQAQGKYRDAQPLYERVVAIWERELGTDHPRMAISLNNLAELYRKQALYAQAQPLYERALAILERSFGRDHPYIINGLNNLALLYTAQKAYIDAKPRYEWALAISEQVLGPSHPTTGQSLNNLAEVYFVQEAYEQAQALYERALAIFEQALGAEHPSTAQTLNNLAELYCVQGDTARAMPFFRRALVIYHNALGPDHPNTQQVRTNFHERYASMHLGALPTADTREVQLGKILNQAQTRATAALADPAADRYALATAIEARARVVEEQGMDDHRALAVELRALIPLLGVEPGDPDAQG